MIDDDNDEMSPGTSDEQQKCEPLILAAVGEVIGCELRAKRLTLPDRGYFTVDGCSDDGSVMCEAWAHQGSLKRAQKAKVMTDAAKLFLAGTLLETEPRKLIAFADAVAARPFQGKSWMAAALKLMRVEIIVVDIAEDVRAAIRAAQIRQYR